MSIVGSHKVTEEELIHKELVAIYLETSDTGFVSKSVWQRVNSLIQKLSSNNSRYIEYLLNSLNIGESIPVMTFKQTLRSVISVMSAEFSLEDIGSIIKNNRVDQSTNINNTSFASQNTNISIDQSISLVIKEIENNLTQEQINIIKPMLDEYKLKPTRNASEKLLRGIFDLGKDIGVGIISNIISKQMGL